MKRRSGFTIVELLVAMSLILFMMAILSQAFAAALKTFRDMKAVVDMSERLRAVGTILHRELAADHFDDGKKLSQPDFWKDSDGNTAPPRAGFFRVFQGSAPGSANYVTEAQDVANGSAAFLASNRATDHMLHFTVKLKGNDRGDFFSTGNIPSPTASPLLVAPLFQGPRHYQENGGNVYNSQWAEVAYFLRSNGQNANGTPLFALFRRQLLLVPESLLLTDASNTPTTVTGTKSSYPEMSCTGGTSSQPLYFNSPRDVTMPARRFGMSQANASTALAGVLAAQTSSSGVLSYPTMADDTFNAFQGTDLMLTDVVSFEVRVLPVAVVSANTLNGSSLGSSFTTLYDSGLTNYLNGNTSYSSSSGPRVFDTWSNRVDKSGGLAAAGTFDYSGWSSGGSAVSIPFKTDFRIAAIQVTIRIWDSKTEQTRQITITQDL